MAAAGGGAVASCVPFRVTLLGPAQGGKTSLANAFVNHFTPSVYTPTDDPVLYYKTMSLSLGKEGPEGERETLPVIVEIEDTYASERADGEDSYGRRRDLVTFTGLFAAKEDYAKWREERAGPPSLFGALAAPALGSLAPVSRVRMAFMIVFDVGDQQSFREAMNVHTALLAGLDRERRALGLKEKVLPVIFLVANKADRGARLQDHLAADVKHYAIERGMEDQLFFVSALEMKQVKELFRKALRKVYEKHSLWDLGGKVRPGKGAAMKKMGTMHNKVFESGQRAVASGQAAVKAGQENCGLQ